MELQVDRCVARTSDCPPVMSSPSDTSLSVTGSLHNASSFLQHDNTRRDHFAVSDNHLIYISEQPLRYIPPSTARMPRRPPRLPDFSTFLMV